MQNKEIQIIKAIYKDVNAGVIIEDSNRTQEFKIKIGVRQGCHLSATLFNMYIDGLVVKLMKGDTYPPSLTGAKVSILLYADDLVLISETMTRLKKAIKIMEGSCDSRKIEVNINKTKIMILSKSGRKSLKNKWWYNGKQLETVREYNYLGIKMTSDGKWKKSNRGKNINGEK